MLNHFFTHLLNQPQEIVSCSLFFVPVDSAFRPVKHSPITSKIDTLLFGKEADVSLKSYRFFQFLQIISACGLFKHVLRFDTRETYRKKRPLFNDPQLFLSSITPDEGISLRALPETLHVYDLPMRKFVSILLQDGVIAKDLDEKKPITVKQISSSDIVLPSLGISVQGLEEHRTYLLDVRNPPKRQISEVVESILSLTASEYFDLFLPLRKMYPEYEKGFRYVTDTLHKFCMILFAQAISLEQHKTQNA